MAKRRGHRKFAETPLRVCETPRRAARALRKLERCTKSEDLASLPVWRKISFSDNDNDKDTRSMASLSKLRGGWGLAEELAKAMGDFHLIEALIIDSGDCPRPQALHKDAPLRHLGVSERRGWALRVLLFPLHKRAASLLTRTGEVQIGPSQHAVFCPVSTPHGGTGLGGQRVHLVCARRVKGKKATMGFQTLKKKYIRHSEDVELSP